MSASEDCLSIAVVARCWGRELTLGLQTRIAGYFVELLRWNQRVNLTGAKTFGELVDEHLPDAFALASLCSEGASVVDVGAGGGLPGVPFAVLRPDCRVTLVEPRAKRVAFLHAAVRLAGLRRVSVVRARVEDLEASSFLFAVSRATFAPEDWLVAASRLVSSGGTAAVLAARPLGGVVGPGRLAQSKDYTTVSGAPRWLGLYCFT